MYGRPLPSAQHSRYPTAFHPTKVYESDRGSPSAEQSRVEEVAAVGRLVVPGFHLEGPMLMGSQTLGSVDIPTVQSR